jgi:hypothetical protein
MLGGDECCAKSSKPKQGDIMLRTTTSSVCTVLAVVVTVAFAMADCTDPEFIEALKTTYNITETEELWKTTKQVACSQRSQGFANNFDGVIPVDSVPTPLKDRFSYDDVRKACNQNDDAFFKKNAKAVAVRFLPERAFDVLLACPLVSRLEVKSEYSGGSCSQITVTATWKKRDAFAPRAVTVRKVHYPDSFQCDSGLAPKSILKSDSSVIAHCKRKINDREPFIFEVTPDRGSAISSRALQAFASAMNVQTGVNILEKSGVKRIDQFRGSDLKSCQIKCVNDAKCVAFAYRHKEEPNYPHECWLYSEPRDQFFTGDYEVITSGIKETVAACK